MITIEEGITKKVPGETSLFISFDYRKELVDIVKLFSGSNYSKKDKKWEVPLTYLSRFLDAACKFDSIELKLLKEKKSQTRKFEIGPFKVQPFKHQEEAVQFGLNHSKWLLLDSPGLGKAFSLDTPVLTPKGYKPIGDLQLGDVVYDENGHKTQVTAIYDHQDLEMYKITFFDGVSVICCKDHLWQINYRKTNTHLRTPGGCCKRKLVSEVKSTEWIATHNYRGSKVSVPVISQPVVFDSQNLDLPMKPYLLGALLGDGNLGLTSVHITSADEEILTKVRQNLPPQCTLHKLPNQKYDYSIVRSSQGLNSKQNIIIQALKQLNLLGHISKTKFIPDIYKYASVEDRLELLRGLLDTDGYVSKKASRKDKFYSGTLQFTTVSSQLFEDFCEVVESLGGLVSRHARQSSYMDKKTGKRVICQLAYTGTIWMSDPTQLLTLSRKLSRLDRKPARTHRHIINVERVSNAPGRCITVDSPSHLYIAKNCLVTHNTSSTIMLAQELQKRGKIEHCLVICGLNTLKGNWRREIENFSDLSGIILGERVTKKGTRKIGSVAERAAHLMKPIDEFFVITNVESLRDNRIIEGILKGPNKFDMILLDEAHKCKGHSQQADGLLKLESAPYKIAMTGTPIVSSPLDAYVPLTWLGIERGTRTNFKYYYCTFDGPFSNMVTGYKNMDVLQGIIDKHSLRRTKDILNLPPKMQIVEYVDMEPDQAQFYENIKQGIKDQVDKVKLNTTSLLALLTRLRQATSSPSILTTEKISCAKIDRAVDLTEQIVANNEKVVIFTSFKEVTENLASLLKQYNPLVCTGDSSEEFINESKDSFQQDDIHQVFIATWQKMGTGLTLNRSSNVIFIDTPYTAADKQQAEDRCHRIGTKQTVNIYTLITAGTVDERVQEIVNKKEALSDYLVDGQITQEGLKSLKQYIEEL